MHVLSRYVRKSALTLFLNLNFLSCNKGWKETEDINKINSAFEVEC